MRSGRVRAGAQARGGDVYALAMDPEVALMEYLEKFYNMRRAGKTLTKIGAVDFATTIAPGLGDVLVAGKVMEATRRRPGGGRGHLQRGGDRRPADRPDRAVPQREHGGRGPGPDGPDQTQADTVAMIRSPQTAVHFVTPLEEMPVEETLDGFGELRGSGGRHPARRRHRQHGPAGCSIRRPGRGGRRTLDPARSASG